MGARDDPSIRISKNCDEMRLLRLKIIETIEVVEAADVLRTGKSLLRTSE